jgi:hypothetical protein
MQTFIVIQNVASFRVDWRRLHDPERHRLALIVSPENHDRLTLSKQDIYFDKVVVLDEFTLERLTTASRTILRELGVRDLRRVRVLTHDEYSLGVTALLRETLGVEGARYDEVRSFIDKLEMKRALADAGVAVPRHTAFSPHEYRADPRGYVERVGRELSYPVFAKPVDESGSVGTARLETPGELHDWCRDHLEDGPYELDEFVSGTLYHCDSIIRDGSVLYTQVSEYAHPCFDYLAGAICASVTLPKDSAAFHRLARFTDRVLASIPAMPADTVTHLEVFEKTSGELVFLEIAARAPAAMVPYTYEKHLGLNIEEAHFRLQMGLLDEVEPTAGPYAAWAYFPHRPGTVSQLHSPVLASRSRVDFQIRPHDVLVAPTDIRDFACRVMLWNQDYDELRRDLAYLDGFHPYTLADPTVAPTLS